MIGEGPIRGCRRAAALCRRRYCTSLTLVGAGTLATAPGCTRRHGLLGGLLTGLTGGSQLRLDFRAGLGIRRWRARR
jgi:hypothetical protein